MENLSTVTCGAPSKKYAEIIPSVDGVSSFFTFFHIFISDFDFS
jgi:hypothetical protein